jgi:acyl carrier protein
MRSGPKRIGPSTEPLRRRFRGPRFRRRWVFDQAHIFWARRGKAFGSIPSNPASPARQRARHWSNANRRSASLILVRCTAQVDFCALHSLENGRTQRCSVDATDGILQRGGEIMSDTLDLDDLKVKRETTADDVEEWDSLTHVRLIVAIERAFKIKFSNAEIERLRNVGELVDAIASKTGQTAT